MFGVVVKVMQFVQPGVKSVHSFNSVAHIVVTLLLAAVQPEAVAMVISPFG